MIKVMASMEMNTDLITTLMVKKAKVSMEKTRMMKTIVAVGRWARKEILGKFFLILI